MTSSVTSPQQALVEPTGHAPHGGSDDPLDTSSVPPRRRRVVLAAVLGVSLAAAGVGVAAARSDAGAASQDGVDAIATPRSTATVQTRDIVTTTDLDGTLTYADSTDVAAGLTGTVTWLPDTGAVVGFGEALYEVDGQPVILLPGDLPQWRALSTSSEDGKDVAVLEQALVDLGYGDADTLTVDEEFTAVTASAVEALREAVGLSEGTGIELGEVAYAPTTLRVAGTNLVVGARVSSGTSVMTATSPDRIVSIALDSAEQGLLTEEQATEVELPDGSTHPAEVTDVSDVARAVTSGGQDATTTYVIDVQLTLGSGGEGFDEAPVTVSLSEDLATGVLAVPVEAVLALAEGGYALEVVQPDGSTQLVAIAIGDFADGWVAIEGDVAEGTEVVSA